MQPIHQDAYIVHHPLRGWHLSADASVSAPALVCRPLPAPLTFLPMPRVSIWASFGKLLAVFSFFRRMAGVVGIYRHYADLAFGSRRQHVPHTFLSPSNKTSTLLTESNALHLRMTLLPDTIQSETSAKKPLKLFTSFLTPSISYSPAAVFAKPGLRNASVSPVRSSALPSSSCQVPSARKIQLNSSRKSLPFRLASVSPF